jgi:hypothetical protein
MEVPSSTRKYQQDSIRSIGLGPVRLAYQPQVLFSQNKPATNNQPAVLFSQNKSAAATSNQPNEQNLFYLFN